MCALAATGNKMPIELHRSATSPHPATARSGAAVLIGGWVRLKSNFPNGAAESAAIRPMPFRRKCLGSAKIFRSRRGRNQVLQQLCGTLVQASSRVIPQPFCHIGSGSGPIDEDSARPPSAPDSIYSARRLATKERSSSWKPITLHPLWKGTRGNLRIREKSSRQSTMRAVLDRIATAQNRRLSG